VPDERTNFAIFVDLENAGGKTGMTSVVTGLGFAVAIFLNIFAFIPSVATGVALTLVGISMVGVLGKIDFKDPVIFFPLIVMVVGTAITGDLASFMCIGLFIWVICAFFSRTVLKDHTQLPTLSTKIMAVVMLAMAITKLTVTI
jgi:xanthine/uracil/vitamin C permease (AzgA family)